MVSYLSVQAVAAKALKGGGVLRGLETPFRTEWDWNIAGGCQQPRPHVLAASSPTGLHSLRVYLMTRCRQCQPCRTFRAITWRDRIYNEIAQSNRTWFGTFTFTPLQHSIMELDIRKRYALRGHSAPWGHCLYKERVKLAGDLMTMFIKRLRFDLGDVKFRYVMVAEPHKNGTPHFHVMFHETGARIGLREIMKSWYQVEIPEDLPRNWRPNSQAGWMKAKLVAQDSETSIQRSSWYLCKYITKTAGTRMRVSFRYGKTVDDHSQQLINKGGVKGGGRSPPPYKQRCWREKKE